MSNPLWKEKVGSLLGLFALLAAIGALASVNARADGDIDPEEKPSSLQCAMYFATSTDPQWTTKPNLVERCLHRVEAARKRMSSGTGEQSKLVCSEDLSAARGKAWEYSRLAQKAQKEGNQALATEYYGKAETYLTEARKQALLPGRTRCVRVAIRCDKPIGAEDYGDNNSSTCKAAPAKPAYKTKSDFDP